MSDDTLKVNTGKAWLIEMFPNFLGWLILSVLSVLDLLYRTHTVMEKIGFAILMVAVIVFGALPMITTGRQYIIDKHGITVIWMGIWRHHFPWTYFGTIAFYRMKVRYKIGNSDRVLICSKKPPKLDRRGLIVADEFFGHPFSRFYFTEVTTEWLNKFESLRRGEIPPDLEDQAPDEGNKYPG